MAFVKVARGSFALRDALSPGWVSIQASGTLSVVLSDMEKIGITQGAIVMMCKETRRIALRAPDDGEHAEAYKLSAQASKGKKKPNRPRRSLNIRRVLVEMGLDLKSAKGRRELSHKDNMAYFSVLPAPTAAKTNR